MIAAGYTHYSFYKRSSLEVAKSKFEAYLSRTQSEIESLSANTALLQSLLHLYDKEQSDARSLGTALELVSKPYTIFIYDNQKKLLFWSNDHVPQPDLDHFSFENPYYQIHQNLYRSILHAQRIAGKTYQILSCIPIRLGDAAEPYGHIDKNLPSTLQLSTTPGIPIITNSGEDYLYIANAAFERLT